MKRIALLLTITLALWACGTNTSKKTETIAENKQTDYIEVLYFHGKQRCITCNAIEKRTKEVVDSLNNAKVVMKIIDISKPENEAITNKYEVSWSSLILSHNDKIENLTEMSFGYAKNKPTEFKTKLIESINKMLQ